MDSDSKNLLSGISSRLNEIDVKLSFVIDLLNSGSGRPSLEALNMPHVPITTNEQQRQINAAMATTLSNLSQVI
jgi:hypothetical protein